jgi:hypothetical protein
MRSCLNFAELDNLAPEYQRKLTESQINCSDLAALEKAMWTAASDVFGLKPGNSGRRPFVNQQVLKLKQTIKVARTLLYMYNRGDVIADRAKTQWLRFRAKVLGADCASLCSVFFTGTDEVGNVQDLWCDLTDDVCKEGLKACITSLRAQI